MSLLGKLGFAASKPFNRAADVIWVRPLHCAAGAPKRYALGALIKETDNDAKITQAEKYVKKWVVNLANKESCIVACEIIYHRSVYKLFTADCSTRVGSRDVSCIEATLNDEQVYEIVENSVYIHTPVVSGDSISFSRKLVEKATYKRAMALNGEFVAELFPPPLFE